MMKASNIKMTQTGSNLKIQKIKKNKKPLQKPMEHSTCQQISQEDQGKKD